MTSEIVRWEFTRPIADLQCGGLRGRVDVSRPEVGFHNLQINGRALDGELLTLAAVDRGKSAVSQLNQWPVEASDIYVRANDLVAAYRPSDCWPIAPQVYWSVRNVLSAANELPAPCSLSLLVSVQTNLLDTHPQICVTTRLPAVEVVELRHGSEQEAQALLWRLVERDWSYLEYVPRSDYSELAIGGDAGGHRTCEWRLFGEFLEKGVIRRARVSAAFLPREKDEQVAAECCRQFAQMPLPLTA